jgi:hypothetical protein
MKNLIYFSLVFAATACQLNIKQEKEPLSKRFFAESSIWNQPIAKNAETDPQSDYYISLLKKDHSRQNFGININEYTIPIYEVDSSVPYIKVGNHPRHNFHHHPDFDSMGVPIPDDFKPSPGDDQHATIIDWDKMLAWDMFLVEKDSSGKWVSCTGIIVPLDGSGVLDKNDYPVQDDESIHKYGPSRAAGVPSFAGTIMYDEVVNGEINHRLSCALRFVALKEYVSPAIWTDGNFKGGIPEGSIIQLDPDLDLSEFNLLPGEISVARAMQKYGMIVVDFAAGNVLYAEGLWIYPEKTWEGLLRDWDGGISSIPLDHYRVLKNNDIQIGGDRVKDFFQEQLEGWEDNL